MRDIDKQIDMILGVLRAELVTEWQNSKTGAMLIVEASRQIRKLVEQVELEANIRLLEDVLIIPGEYIDDGTMVYWSDFNADTLEKIIRDRIAELKARLTQKGDSDERHSKPRVIKDPM